MITLKVAQTIVEHALIRARKSGFRPLSVAVLDARGAVIAVASEDGASFKRFQIAHGKAHGALSFNLGSRALGVMAAERPHFFAGAAHAVGGALVPVAGGVLIRTQKILCSVRLECRVIRPTMTRRQPLRVSLQPDLPPTAASSPPINRRKFPPA